MKVVTTHLGKICSSVATGQAGQSAPSDSENFAENRKKE